MIWETLKPALIFPGAEAASYEEVFQQVGGALTAAGYTKSTYVEALIEREREYPTGLDVDGWGVAIPHTPVEHVHSETVIAIAIFKNPVEFVQMGTDDETVGVRIVFMLAIAGKPGEHGAHLDELQRIIAIIQDTGLLQNLLNAQSAEEIIKLIEEKEKTL